ILGATNRPDSLDPALRRAGRFDREICLGVPDEEARARILQVQCAKLRLSGDFDFKVLAKLTPGFVGADLHAMASTAGMLAAKRAFRVLSKQALQPMERDSGGGDMMEMDRSDVLSEAQAIQHFLASHPGPLTAAELEPLAIEHADFIEALDHVQPSSKREGFAT